MTKGCIMTIQGSCLRWFAQTTKIVCMSFSSCMIQKKVIFELSIESLQQNINKQIKWKIRKYLTWKNRVLMPKVQTGKELM